MLSNYEQTRKNVIAQIESKGCVEYNAEMTSGKNGFISAINFPDRRYIFIYEFKTEEAMLQISCSCDMYCSPVYKHMLCSYLSQLNNYFTGIRIEMDEQGHIYARWEISYNDAPVSAEMISDIETKMIVCFIKHQVNIDCISSGMLPFDYKVQPGNPFFSDDDNSDKKDEAQENDIAADETNSDAG